MRRLGERVPRDERIDRPRERGQVLAEPSWSGAVGRVGRRPDIRALEMRPARIRVANALDQRQAALTEDVQQARQPWMQAERLAARIAADLQQRAGRNRQRRPPAGIERVRVRDEHAEAVVAAG